MANDSVAKLYKVLDVLENAGKDKKDIAKARKMLDSGKLEEALAEIRKLNNSTKTNNTEEKLRIAREKKDFSNIKCLEKDLSFYGSGAILHELFFENMGPAIPTEPDIELMKQIIKDFGSYEIFKEQFTEASKTVEASRLVFVSMGS